MAMDTSLSAGASDALANMSPEQQRELLAKLLREKAERASRFPMSEGQQGLWHSFRRDPNATPFNVFLPSRFRSGLNLQALQQAINLIAERHPALRTTFSDSDGKLLQEVHSNLLPEFQVIELGNISDEAARSVIAKEAQRAFDLETGPLLRMLVYRLAGDDTIVLALTHHIVVDFWSLILILNEVGLAYPAFAEGTTPSLAPPQGNYSEFVNDQAAWLAGRRGEELQSYWRETLADIPPIVEFPLDYLRPERFTGKAGNVALEFKSSTVAQLNRFATTHRTTAFSVIQAALRVLISRYAGQTTFLLGSPFSGRSHKKFEQTVGFFVNMLPLKADLTLDPNFVDLVKQSGATLFDALEHEQYPVSKIVHDVSAPRDPSRSPLFQVSCTFEKAQLQTEAGRAGFLFPGRAETREFAGLIQESFYVPVETCHYDIEFVFEQTQTNLRGIICYCKDLFQHRSVQSIAENLTHLLDSLLGHSSLPVSKVPWQLRPGDRAAAVGDKKTAQLNLHNAAITVHDTDRTASSTADQLIKEAAHRHPQSTAFRFQDQSVTYEQLLRVSNSLAQQLQACGVQLESKVPIVAGRGPAAFAAMLAINQVGGAFIPIDSSQPAVNIQSLVGDCEAPLLVTDESAQVDVDVPNIRFHSEMLRTTEETPVRSKPTPTSLHTAENLAYVVYTSGSTGKPKGVMVGHAAICNTLHWRMRDVPLSPNDRVLMLLSHQFDAGIGIAWTTLTQGATLVCADESTLQDTTLLIDLIIRERVTILPAPPSLLSLLVSHPRFCECAAQLKNIWTGGEALPPDLPEQVRNLTRARFFNFYGPTEAAVEATFCEVTNHDKQRPVPIGHAIAGAEVLILDENHCVVPDTVPGELAIGGAGLARGYLNDDALTRKKFIPHPELGEGRSRVYLTGDRGRRNADGLIEFFGRTDHQIKLRGYRIELGEIEAAIESAPNVGRAAVKLVGESTPNAQLVAYISRAGDLESPKQVPPKRMSPDAFVETVRLHVADRLASFKRPSSIVVVDKMPLTASGKVDRKRLPSTAPAKIHERAIVACATAIEESIHDIWCRALKQENVGVKVNFFDAGGSSLQAAMVTSELSQELGVPVPTALLFDLADVRQIARRLAELHPQEMATKFGEEAVATQLADPNHDGACVSTRHPLLVPLNPTGPATPVFMVHPPGGIVVCYRELARQLPSTQPLYGIRSHGLHGDEQLPATIEEMAAAYVEALRSVQPSGPYLLGGWSLGGLIAYEVAQQLIAANESVKQLVLLDTSIPSGATDLVPESEQVNVGLEYGIELTLDQLGELTPEEQLPFLWQHAKNLGVVQDDSSPEVVAQALEDLQGLFHHHVAVARAYKMLPTAVPITLFRPTEVPFELDVSEDRGWRHLASNVDVQFVPGHHHSMVQHPQVAELAGKLQRLLKSL